LIPWKSKNIRIEDFEKAVADGLPPLALLIPRNCISTQLLDRYGYFSVIHQSIKIKRSIYEQAISICKEQFEIGYLELPYTHAQIIDAKSLKGYIFAQQKMVGIVDGRNNRPHGDRISIPYVQCANDTDYIMCKMIFEV
jgi:hypothetical protein